MKALEAVFDIFEIERRNSDSVFFKASLPASVKFNKKKKYVVKLNSSFHSGRICSKNTVPVKTAIFPRCKALPIIVESSTGRSLIPCCSNNLMVSFSEKQNNEVIGR